MSTDTVGHEYARNPPRSRKIAHFRAKKMKAQQGLCYYCRQPMWAEDRERERFCSRFEMSPKKARHFRCTAEHLVAICDGGDDVEANIVAACRFCNRMRHARRRVLTPERYKAFIWGRLAKGGWHGFCVNSKA